MASVPRSKAGCRQRQAQKLVDQYRDRYAAQIDLSNKQIDSEILNGKAILQRDWGSEYETRRSIAKRRVSRHCPRACSRRPRTAGWRATRSTSRRCTQQRVSITGERQPRPPGEAADSSPDNLRNKIASFRQQYDAALKDAAHPEHDLRLRELTELHNRLFVEAAAC